MIGWDLSEVKSLAPGYEYHGLVGFAETKKLTNKGPYLSFHQFEAPFQILLKNGPLFDADWSNS
jgi:hypothetical protein